MAQQKNGSIKVGRDANKVWRERLEEIEEAIVREAQHCVTKGFHAMAKPRLDAATRMIDTLDVYNIIDETLFGAILGTEAGFSALQVSTEVTLVRCRLADVPEAWDMGGQASTRMALPDAA